MEDVRHLSTPVGWFVERLQSESTHVEKMTLCLSIPFSCACDSLQPLHGGPLQQRPLPHVQRQQRDVLHDVSNFRKALLQG